MLLKLKKYITKQDKFGSQIKFAFKKNQIHRTFYGGIFTLFSYILIILVSFYFGQDLWIRSNPNTVFSEEIVDMPERFDINHESLSFVFGL